MKSLDWFKINRPKQWKAAFEILDKMFYFDDNDNRIVKSKYAALWAPLKWGKREVLDIIALACGDVEFIYLAPPHKSLISQKEELESCGWNIDDRKGGFVKKWDSNKIYVVAFDEADWGDGKGQQFYRRYCDYPNVILLGISATNFTFVSNLENLLFQNCVVGEKYTNYKGLENFPLNIVDNKAIEKDGTFTPTFEKVIRKWLKATLTTDKVKFIVRETKFSSTNEDRVEEQLRQLCLSECGNSKVDLVVVDQDHNYKWKKNNGDSWLNGGRQLFVVKQTFTRATETDIQKFLYGYYDYRSKQTALNTIAQALGRFPNYNDICDIELFVSADHKKYVDVYLEVEKEILSGNSLLSVLDKHKDVMYSAKLKPTGTTRQTTNKRGWLFDFRNPILFSNVEDFQKWDEQKNEYDEIANHAVRYNSVGDCGAGSHNNRIFIGIRNNSAPDGQWDYQKYDFGYVVFYPGIRSIDNEWKDLLSKEGVWDKLLVGNIVVVRAKPFDLKSNDKPSFKDKSCFPQTMNGVV